MIRHMEHLVRMFEGAAELFLGALALDMVFGRKKTKDEQVKN